MGSSIRRTVVEQLSLSSLLPIIRFGYGFGLAAILSKQLSVADYGQWSLFISNMFLVLSVASANLMYSASIILTGKDFPEQRKDIFTVGLFKIGLTLVVFAGFATYLHLKGIFDPGTIGLMGLVLLFVSISNLVFGLLRALLRLKRQTLFLFVECALIISGVAISTFVLSAGLKGAIYAYLLAECGAAVVGVVLLRRYICLTKFSVETIKAYLKMGIPLLPFALSALIVDAFVPLMIKLYDNFEAVAVYSIAQKVALTVTIPNAIINNIYAQYLKRSRIESGFSGVRRTFFRFVGGYVGLTVPMLALLYVFGMDIINFVSTEAYAESYELMLALATVNVMITLTAMITVVFAVYNKTRVLGFIWIGVLAFYLVANHLLVPTFGMRGVSASLLMTFGLGLVVIAGLAIRMGRAISDNEDDRGGDRGTS
jgi:O-antigen/teichoic acid export membrane protein